ncbi:response regulator [Teredinibacter turnerae]|uniref:response regulator n=1 Tax=Teredinibacter turnerae TaxID=2426 RepID=UPI0003759896|nr:response regulator [Teredinibacter turnerae]
MKQIEIIKTYSQKRCLVVDDVPDIRTSLKRILIDFGANDVDTAGNAEEAIDICHRHQYDLVLADYNLGAGKNGQQLLEELRFHKLLKNTALYVMVTAESGSQYVLHALEYQPDDYLAKPVSRDGLRPRLDAALLKNEALLNAKRALDKQNPLLAIKACTQVITSKSRYSNDARKMLGELLISQRRFQQALEVYQYFPAGRQPIWCRLGIARAHTGLLDYATAEQHLQALIDENARCVEAHDLLAELYEQQNRYQQAQQVLTDAVAISPRSTERQREMGRISLRVGDDLAAVHAYRYAVKHSRNSCRELPEDYLYLAQSLTNVTRAQPETQDKFSSEALETLKAVEKKYGTQPVVAMRGRLVESEIYRSQNQPERADSTTSEALDILHKMKFSAIQNTPVELCIDCARAFMAQGQYDAGEMLLQELARINKDPAIAVRIDKLLREPVTQEGIQYATKLNKQGILHYQAQDYVGAVIAFRDVLRELPNHIGLNLNLIQAIVSKSRGGDLSDEDAAVITSSFQRIGNIDVNSSYYDRYDYLKRHYQKLSQADGES